LEKAEQSEGLLSNFNRFFHSLSKSFPQARAGCSQPAAG
jgi:hypothetical protein